MKANALRNRSVTRILKSTPPHWASKALSLFVAATLACGLVPASAFATTDDEVATEPAAEVLQEVPDETASETTVEPTALLNETTTEPAASPGETAIAPTMPLGETAAAPITTSAAPLADAPSLGGYSAVAKTYLKDIGAAPGSKAIYKDDTFGEVDSAGKPLIPNSYLSIVGPYQFNIAGNTVVEGKPSTDNGKTLHSAVDPNAEQEAGYRLSDLTTPVTTKVGGQTEEAPRTNSSSSVLQKPETANTHIYKAFLVVTATQTTKLITDGVSPMSTYGAVTLKGPQGGMIRCWPEYIFSDNFHQRTSTFFEVTDFVKEQGYGLYTGVNIPCTPMVATGPAGSDYFGAWKLIVVEENADVPVRMLRMRLGGTTVSTATDATVTISGEGLSVAGNASNKPTGELLVSMDGSDYMDSTQTLSYSTDTKATGGNISNAFHPANTFYSLVADRNGKQLLVDPEARAGDACGSGKQWTQMNTDLCVMGINDKNNNGSLKLNGGEKTVTLLAETNKNPTILSALGLAIDIVVPTFNTKMIFTNLDRHYSSDADDYNPHVDYAQEGDRMRATVLATNTSPEDKKQLGLENATLSIAVPALRTVNLESDVIARYKSFDGNQEFNLNVKGLTWEGDTPIITVQAEQGTTITRTGYFEVIFEGTAKGTEDYTEYSNSASIMGSFVDETGTTHKEMFMEKLGLVYKTTASDTLRFPVTSSSTGEGTVTVTGDDGIAGSYPTDGTVTVTVTPKPGNHVQAIVVDGVVRDDLISEDGTFTLPVAGSSHDIRVVYAPNDPTTGGPSSAGSDYLRVSTSGDKGVATLTETRNVERGSSLTVSWSVAPGYRLHEVLVDGIPYSHPEAGSLTLSNIAVEHSVVVRTISDYYSISTIVRGAGKISPSTTVTRGGSYTVDWEPTSNDVELAYVYIDGEKRYDSHAVEHAEGAFSSFTFDNVSADHTVEVVYKHFDEKNGTTVPGADAVEESFVVATQLVGGPGTISPSVELKKGSAGNVNVSWTVGNGFHLDRVILTQGATRTELTVSGDSVTLPAVSSDCTVQVVLKNDADRNAQTYAIDTSMVGGPSSITNSMANLVPGSSGHEVVWSAAPGYRVASILVDGVPRDDLLTTNRIRFDNIAADHSVIVSVQPLKTLGITGYYSITVTYEGSGIAGQSASVARNGSHVVTWTPDANEHVVRVLVDDVEVPTTATASAQSSVAEEALPMGAALRTSLASVRAQNFTAPRASNTGAYTFENIGADHRIHIVFSEGSSSSADKFTVTGTIEGGEGTISEDARVTAGDNHTVSWTVGDDCTVQAVYVDGKQIPTPSDNSYTFEDIAANHSVRVVLKSSNAPDPSDPDNKPPVGYQQISIVGSGNGTVWGSAFVPNGQSHQVGWKAEGGKRPDHIYVDGVLRDDLLTATTLDFSNITEGHRVYIQFEGGEPPADYVPGGSSGDDDTWPGPDGWTIDEKVNLPVDPDKPPLTKDDIAKDLEDRFGDRDDFPAGIPPVIHITRDGKDVDAIDPSVPGTYVVEAEYTLPDGTKRYVRVTYVVEANSESASQNKESDKTGDSGKKGWTHLAQTGDDLTSTISLMALAAMGASLALAAAWRRRRGEA